MLTEARHLFPLGRAFSPLGVGWNGAAGPFGLRYAVAPPAVVDVDVDGLDYDPDRQIAVLRDGGAIVPAMRHTSTRTKTQTGGGGAGLDDDEDTTGT